MKKIIMVIAIACIACLVTACGSAFECGFCGEEKTGKKHTTDFYGDELTVCDDCYNDIKEAVGY